MDKETANDIFLELTKIKEENLEELYLISKYSLQNIIYYIFHKKSKSDIPKRCLEVIKDFLKIIKEENKIINLLKNHIIYIDEEKLIDYIAKLDDLNKKTIEHFYKYLDDIEDAIELDNLNRVSKKRDFKTLPENKNIKIEACDLIFSKKFIMKYLGFEKEFWNFINCRTTFVEDLEEYEINWEYVPKTQIKLSLKLPIIKDFKTAITCAKAYSKAHILYFYNNKISYYHAEDKLTEYYYEARKSLNI